MTQLFSGSDTEAVESRRSAVKQAGLFTRARTVGQPLAGVPEHAVTVGTLVDRKIAFKHGAIGTECRDAGLDVGPPCRGELLRARWQLALVQVEAKQSHAEATELHVHVGARRKLADAGTPLGEHRVAFALVA